MERLELKLNDAKASLKSLQEVLKEPCSIYIRDATIKRFEYTFDTYWKFLKELLKIKKGLAVNSPKDCFREIFSQGYSSEEETEKSLDMADDRNETVHSYKEAVAQEIYSKIKGYSELMSNVFQRVSKNL